MFVGWPAGPGGEHPDQAAVFCCPRPVCGHAGSEGMYSMTLTLYTWIKCSSGSLKFKMILNNAYLNMVLNALIQDLITEYHDKLSSLQHCFLNHNISVLTLL